MTLADLLGEFRTRADDKAKPYLWSDLELTTWLNEAQDEACRRADLLVDSSTAEIVNLTALAGDPWIPYDNRILKIKRVRVAAGLGPDIVQAPRLDGIPQWETQTGTVVQALVEGLETLKFRVFPIQTVDLALTLTVSRLALDPLVNATDEPEIRPQFHLKLVDWMLFRAYSKNDVDTQDLAKATRYEKAFIAEFGVSSARQEHWLREHGNRDLMTGEFA